MAKRPFARIAAFRKVDLPALERSLDPKDFPGFSQRDLRAMERYYRFRFIRHQTPEQKVGWNSSNSQKIRFEALAQIGRLEGAKILDVGCGLGSFLDHLEGSGQKTRYTGVDLFAAVIREAKRLHPQARFEARNILKQPFLPRTFDYIFLSGVFNVKVQNNWKYMAALLGTALKQCRKGLAFNALNAEAGLREPDRFFVTPSALKAFVRRFPGTRSRLLDHYHPLDLTLLLYK